MELPHNFTEEYAQSAVEAWRNAQLDGKLIPKDAYDAVVAISLSISDGITVPKYGTELILVADILQLVPVSEGDHK